MCGLEDKKLLRIVLVKSHRDAANCWKSLLEGQYAADAYVLDQMEKKLTLERFQNEVDTYCMYLYIHFYLVSVPVIKVSCFQGLTSMHIMYKHTAKQGMIA